jgi:sigma-B regulation protein RsbU (phosphoserine phosphatase)
MLEAANRRVFSVTETRAGQFATIFYGILDPATGTLVYCNAGHCPSLLLSTQNGGEVQELDVTGVPLGLFAGETWERRVVQLAPGDGLLLYTDGVTEARNVRGEFFDEERLIAAVNAHIGRPAHDVREAVLEAVRAFVGEGVQRDDIALIAVVRDAA